MACQGCGGEGDGKDAIPEITIRHQKDGPPKITVNNRPDKPDPKPQGLLRGALQMGRVKMGGKIDGKVAKMRLAVCTTCPERVKDKNDNDTGEKLFRYDNETPYCGVPWREQTRRLVYHEGCGCNLQDKTLWKIAECPRGLWGPGANFGKGVRTVYRDKSKGTLKDVIDMHVMSKDQPPDISGIGDTLSFLPMVRAMRTANPDKQVRYVIMKTNHQWASLGYDDIVFEDDIDRIPGEVEHHSADTGCMGVLAKCTERGYTWHQFWEERFGLKTEVFRITPEPGFLLDAKQRLADPIIAGKPIIALSPFTGAEQKSWPKRHWLELAYMLQEAGFYIYVIDGPDPKRSSMFPCMRFWGWPAKKLVGLLSLTDLHIGNDSSGSHLAGLMGIPGMVLCSQTNGWSIYGGYKSIEVMQAEGPCTECLWDSARGWKPPCATACILLWDMRPKMVFEAIMSRLEKEKKDELLVG